jgi:two-component system sensor histidine kinase RpfC
LVAADGEEALDLYEREQPDVALLDFNMPNRNGLEVIRAIRMMEPPGVRMPAIILSASVTLEARDRAQNAGADDFVGKPFDAAALIQKVDNLSLRLVPRSKEPSNIRNLERQGSTEFPGRLHNAAVRTSDGVLDLARLAELEDISRDTKFMTNLLRGFKRDVEALLRRLDDCVAAANFEVMGDLLHALKGAAVGIGALQLSQRCDESGATNWHDPVLAKQMVINMRHCVKETFLNLDDYVRTQHRVSL